MPELLATFKKAYWFLAALGGAYAILLALLSNGWAQRHALYAHKANTLWWRDVYEPEGFGFARRQVTPFNISSPDNQSLFAWHVLPTSIYAANEDELAQEPMRIRTDFKATLAYRLLTEDPEAKVVVMFHGNAGHIAQAHRPQIYRSLSLLSPHVHVLAIDYRGFGHSDGEPNEPGLILDGIALVQFALSLGISPDRIIILGQSLGTAVSSAVSLHFADREASMRLLPESVQQDDGLLRLFEAVPTGISFAAVVLVASFPSLPQLLLTYRLAGFISVLAPLRFYPRIQALLQALVVDQWPTAKRLAALVSTAATRPSMKLNLKLMHAFDDREIPWRNGEMNWQSASTTLEKNAKVQYAARETVRREYEGGDAVRVIWRNAVTWGTMLERKDIDFGYEGVKRKICFDKGRVNVTFDIVKYGGHNEVVAGIPATLAVLKGFGFA